MTMLFCIFSKYGVVTSDDLWSILHNIKDSEDDLKSIFSEVKSIKEVIEPWITQKGFPIIEVWQNDDLLRLTQKSSAFKLSFNKQSDKWWIPVTYMTATDVAHNQSRLTFPLKWFKPTETLTLEITNFAKIEHNWYLINVGQMGEYCSTNIFFFFTYSIFTYLYIIYLHIFHIY